LLGGGFGQLGLHFYERATQSLQGQVGAQLDSIVELGNGATLNPYIRAAYVREFKPDRSIKAEFLAAPGFSFIERGAMQERDSARLDAGVTLTTSQNVSLFAQGATTFADRTHTYQGMAGLHVRW
jgi:outer membrane autotransporter protein